MNLSDNNQKNSEASEKTREEDRCISSKPCGIHADGAEMIEQEKSDINGRLSMFDFKWFKMVPSFSMGTDSLCIATLPHTDLWQRTYYHFRNDNAPLFLAQTERRYFSFSVMTEFSESLRRFDQCGIVVYLDSENWLKASVECENDSFRHLGSVVTNHGYSDWATTEIPASETRMWFRLNRREDDFRIECSRDGIVYSQMRICHLAEAKSRINFGVYACSPEESCFVARFYNFSFGECIWPPHDGQKPDLI